MAQQECFFKQSMNPVRNTYNSFIICKLWTSTKFVRLELSEKTLPLPKYEDIMLNSMTQTWEK